MNPNHPPPKIPDHDVIRCIGRGSYGEVWLAKAITGFRAVKVVFRDAFETEQPYEREFAGIKNYEPISRSHEGLVQVLHVGRNDEDQFFYYIMELADDASRGQEVDPSRYTPKTLSIEKHTRSRIPAAECVELGLTLTSALQFLHSKQLVHRDIKPSNIIFVNGKPKLADIGLVTQMGQVSFVGALDYMPPERPGTAQADVFSFGKVLYEVSTGKDVREFPELPTSVTEEHELQSLIRLTEVLGSACAKNVEDRYASAQQMHDDLLALQQGKPLARPAWGKRLRSVETALKVVVLVAVLALAAVGGYWLMRQRGSTPLAPREGQVVLKDDFGGTGLNSSIWTWNHFESSYQGTGHQERKVTQQEGILLIEGTAEHEGGWTSIQDVWVESVMDFKGQGDVVLEIEFEGEARNGALAVTMSDGNKPSEREDPGAVRLYQSWGGNHDPLVLGPRRLQIELLQSSNTAVVFTREEAFQGYRTIDLSSLSRWKLRFFAGCSTSAGFRSGYARLRLLSVRAAQMPEQTGVVGLVLDEITGRPLAGAIVKRSDGAKLAETGLDGSFTATLPAGETRLAGELRDYLQRKPVTVNLVRGERKLITIFVTRTRFGFGDVVSSFPYGTNPVMGIEVGPGGITCLTRAESGSNSVYRISLEGREAEQIAAGSGLVSLTLCGNELYAAGAWPGAIYRLDRGQPDLLHTLRTDRPQDTINWPRDLAFDGKLLWFVENTKIDDRYGLCALNLDSRVVVVSLPTRDRQISGLAWDGKNLWVSSGSGRVYEVNSGMAMAEGSVEAGIGREFKGHYASLSFADGHLWGLDTETKRICKVRVH